MPFERWSKSDSIRKVSLRIRNVIEEFEVKLKPVPSAPPVLRSADGKGEWKVYGDGSRQCKVSVLRVDLPDDTSLQLAINGRGIGEMKVQRKTARYKRESERGEGVPKVEASQRLQIILAGEIVLEGMFYAE